MRLLTRPLLFLFLFLLLLAGCSVDSGTSERTHDVTELEQRIQTLRDLRLYKQLSVLIDSVEQTGTMPEAWILGQRGSIYYVQRDLQQATQLLDSALADGQLKKNYYQSYLNYSLCMVACKVELNKWEEALRLAKDVCEETRYSTSLQELLVSVRSYAYIGSCQVHLHRWDEARVIGETAINACYDYEQQTPDASRETFFVALTMLEAYNDVSRWAEVEQWVTRARQALENVPLFKDTPSEYDHWTGYLYSLESVALDFLGRSKEGAEAYSKFMSTQFSKGLGGLNAIYYLTATRQWDKMEAMLPVVDSLVAFMGAEMTPEHLIERFRYQYLAYRNLGKNDKALAVADSVSKYVDRAINNERQSKALDLATLYETHEKELELQEKDRQIGIMWTGVGAGVMLLIIFGLAALYFVHRRSEKRLMAEHQKLEEAYDQLMVANARAEESSKMKTSFIRQVSHEIRTPLNILSGFTQVLTTPDLVLDEQTKAEASKSIVANTHRITRLVNKMLELSDISSKAVIERTDEILAGDVAMQAVSESGIQEIPSVTFTFDADENVINRVIKTNLRSAVRSLVLLLDNAHKFLGEPQKKAEGIVTLRIVEDKNLSRLCFIVEDTGIGVPAEEAEHIFDEFVQLDDYYDGTGIGLTVARSLTRRIGGNIVLDTSYHDGARFVMSLPA